MMTSFNRFNPMSIKVIGFYFHQNLFNDNAPTHERRKLVKIYKNVLPQKRTVAVEVCGETYKNVCASGVQKQL